MSWARFPAEEMWIDGEEVATAPYDGQGVIYEAAYQPVGVYF